MSTVGAVTGRYQPVHEQHLELFELALRECDRIVVAVTNPDSGARHQEPTSAHRHTRQANPFSYYERSLLLAAALTERGFAERAVIVPFDLRRPLCWPEYVPAGTRHYVRAYGDWEREKAGWFRKAGYPVTIVDGDEARKVSASDVRVALLAGEWHPALPPATVPVLRGLLAERGMDDR